jgi:hypothetical protein
MEANFRKLCIDAYRGVPTAFAEGNPTDVIVNKIKEANNGSTTIDYKAIRDGKCPELFSVIEELIDVALDVATLDDSPLKDMIETKNGEWGDKPEFLVPDNSLLTVDVVANGTQGIRRQRLIGGQKVPLTPVNKAVKIYDELILILSGRIDWVEFVNRVAKSFEREFYASVAKQFNNLSTARFTVTASGSPSESGLLNLIEKVEAATGKTAYVLGTRTALRNFPMSQIGETVKDDYYAVGYSQSFNGTPCIRLKNYLDDAGNFVLSDTRVYVLAGDDKIIKHYIEGEPIVIARDAADNADLTQEYTVIRREGIAVVVSATMGVYDFT